MTVENQFPYQSFTANGSQNHFPLGFYIDDKNHFEVIKNDQAVAKNEYSYNSSSNSIVFNSPPNQGDVIEVQRSTTADRATTYATYNNSFRPEVLNKDIDRIWWKLQELGVADWILSSRIDGLKNYVDRKDDELKAYLIEEIRKQGVALDQLDEYYNYLMQRLAQIAIDKGWDATFVVDFWTSRNLADLNIQNLDKTTGKIKESAVLLETGLTLKEKLTEVVSIKDYGAIGDGTLHILQEWVTAGKYKNLAEIQAKFSFVTSLDQSIDWCATQYAVFNHSSVYCPKGKYVLSDTVETPHNTTPYNVGNSSSGVKIYGEGAKTAFTRNDTREATRIFNTEGTSTTHESDVANSLEACFSIYCPYTTITDMTLQDSAIGIFVGQNYKKAFSSLSSSSKSNFERLAIDRCGTGVLLLACGGNHYMNYSDIHFIRCQIDVHQRSSHWWKITQNRGDSNNNRNTFTRIRSARSRIGMWNECGDTNNYIGWHGETMPSSINPFRLPHGLPTDLTTECLFVFSGSNQLNTVSHCFAESVTTHVYNNGYQNRFTDNGLVEAQVLMVQQPREWKGRYASRDRGVYIADNAYPQMSSLPLAGALYLGTGLSDGTTIANGVRVVSKDMWHTPLANTRGSYEKKYQIEAGAIVKNSPTAFAIWTNTDSNSTGFFEIEVIARSEVTGEIASYITKAYITAHRNSSRVLTQYNCTKIHSTRTTGEGTADAVEANHVSVNIQKNTATPQILELVINSPFDLTTATVFVTQKITK